MASALCIGSAWGMQSGKTPQGVMFATGGIAHGERMKLQAERDQYSLWVVTATSKSGAYLADVAVRIRDNQQRVVFERKLDGPWLLIDLPLGRYEVEASLRGEVHKRMTTIHRGDRHEAVFYFDTGDDVGTDGSPSSKSSSPDAARK